MLSKEILVALVMRNQAPASFVGAGYAIESSHPFGLAYRWDKEALLKLTPDDLIELDMRLQGWGK
jgi:hypothetical protein